MELQQETAKSAVRLFRLLFAFPGDDGSMQTADDPFLRQLKGMIDAFSGNDGEAVTDLQFVCFFLQFVFQYYVILLGE